MHKLVLGICLLLSLSTNAQNSKKNTKKSATTSTEKQEVKTKAPREKEVKIEIRTTYGTMIAKLYNETPLHRDNFIQKVKAGFFDSLLFHRVIKGFMIQGGDPQSKQATKEQMLGNGEAAGGRIPAEFNNKLFHKKGVLAAARDNNPEKASSNCQFYIVQGRKTDTAELRQMTSRSNTKYTPAQIEIYNRIGGTPFLDQNYTVFGEVIAGLEVLDKIAATSTQPGDRPTEDIRMFIKIIND